MIGVTGILNSLPATFPLETHENSGNMVHGDAPFQLFDDAYLAINRDWPGYKPGDRFKDFVNEKCTHVIITCANVFRANDFGENIRKRYVKLVEMLKGYEKPIILFGLGVQAKEQDLSKVKFPPEAIVAMRAIAEKATAVSVRGEFTLSVLKQFGGMENAYVTGCPSFFSYPDAFSKLKKNIELLRANEFPRIAFSGTHHAAESEQLLLLNTIRNNGFFIEPQDRANYRYLKDILENPETAVAPAHFQRLLSGPSPKLQRDEFCNYLSRRLRLFRDIKPWKEFNGEFVDYTFGTRFHVNMASMLEGLPALWITHDSRTRELADALHLPSMDVEQAGVLSISELINATDYEPLFSNLDRLFERFNQFLDAATLPRVRVPELKIAVKQ
jgi:polysaccharide pyruvyl transferase WcaK-like protein